MLRKKVVKKTTKMKVVHSEPLIVEYIYSTIVGPLHIFFIIFMYPVYKCLYFGEV